MAKKSKKHPILKRLFEERVDPQTGNPKVTGRLIVTGDDVVKAIQETKTKLGTKNPANFLKDLLRSKDRNGAWTSGVTELRWSARQSYGEGRVFEFVPFTADQTEPFPDPFDISLLPKPHLIQAVSLDAYARKLGRKDESWLIQTCVSLRLIETHFALYSPMRHKIIDIHHLQNSVKLTPEIDAIFLMTYREEDTEVRAIVTLEAKRDELILVEQIKAQVAKMGAVYQSLKDEGIDTVIGLACRSFGKNEQRRVGIFELSAVSISEAGALDGDESWRLPLTIVGSGAYEFVPSVTGI
ncbi:hypothetical protein ACP4J4_02830 [Aureimonas ureilytica]|uniref:hypothetical protein n=1 Tax=Aureimonas ureilytica TaxID=401562 RepID=UPI003CE908CE